MLACERGVVSLVSARLLSVHSMGVHFEDDAENGKRAGADVVSGRATVAARYTTPVSVSIHAPRVRRDARANGTALPH